MILGVMSRITKCHNGFKNKGKSYIFVLFLCLPISSTHVTLCDYRNLLRRWKRDYAPKTPDEDFHPLFVEALQKQDYVDYLLDVLLSPDMEERAALIIDCGKEVSNLERRMAELAARDTAGRRTDHARSTAAPER